MSRTETDRELRPCAFTVANHFLEVQWILAEKIGLRPVELLIFLTTMMGNAQRLRQPAALSAHLKTAPTLPADMVRPISRRAIARVTGLPKETVRRQVERLAARGVLVVSREGITVMPGLLARKEAKAAVHRLVELQAAHTELLIQIGAIRQHMSDRPKP